MKIELAQILNRAKLRLGLTDTTLPDAYLRKLINEGAMHIDSLQQYIVTCTTLDIDCYKAELPAPYTRLIAIQLIPDGDSGCCNLCENNDEPQEDRVNMDCCVQSCGAIYTADRNVLTGLNDLGVPSCYNTNTYYVQDGYLSLPTNVTATQVKVWYYGYNTDENGIMVFDILQERALSVYAAYQYALTYPEKYRYQLPEWKKEWVAQKNWLRGKATKQDAQLNKGKFAAICSAMVVSPYQVFNNNL